MYNARSIFWLLEVQMSRSCNLPEMTFQIGILHAEILKRDLQNNVNIFQTRQYVLKIDLWPIYITRSFKDSWEGDI